MWKADQQPAGHATDGGFFPRVRVLAESVGMLPCNLYQCLNGSLKQSQYRRASHKLILHASQWLYDAAGASGSWWSPVCACGETFYAYSAKAFGEVAELLPVDPAVWRTPVLNSSWEPVWCHIPGRLTGWPSSRRYLACAHATLDLV